MKPWGEVGGHIQQIPTALAGCRIALVGTGWTISHVGSELLLSPCRGTIPRCIGSFWLGGAFNGQKE